MNRIAAFLCFTALGCGPASAGSEKHSVRAFVIDCYSSMLDVQVSVDGRAIAITAPSDINDSIASCGSSAELTVGDVAKVELSRNGVSRRVSVSIGPTHTAIWVRMTDMTAVAVDRSPALD